MVHIQEVTGSNPVPATNACEVGRFIKMNLITTQSAKIVVEPDEKAGSSYLPMRWFDPTYHDHGAMTQVAERLHCDCSFEMGSNPI